MEALFRIALSNAVAATILALAALLVSRVCRRPALTHALWLLVLVKLITPPLRAIEFDWPGAQESGAVLASAPHAAIADLPEEFPTSDMQPDAAELEMTSERIEIGTPALACQEPAKTVPELDNAAEGAEPVGSAEGSFLARIPWSWALGVGWLIGSGAWLALLVSRTWRFHRLLQPARRARPALQEEVNQLARSLGLARSPEVWLIPGRISPMVWALALRPRIYLPVELWAALDDDQRRALLLHELAHLRRGDHWVRALEIVTTCLFWWHPVVWWAQRELREAEEQCCDAWVLWAMPGAARRYALALVETLDFLSEAQPALPLAASGLGQVHDLRRRLTMIMRGTTPRRLSWTGLLAVAGAAAMLLPLGPTLAQAPPQQEREVQAQRARAEEAVRRAEIDLQKARAEAEVAKARAQEAEARDRQERDRARGADRARRFVIIIQDGDGREVRRIEARPGQQIRVPGADDPEGEKGPSPRRGPTTPPAAGPRPGHGAPGAPGQPPDAPPPGLTPAGPERGRLSGPLANPVPMQHGAAPPGHDQERRLQDLERRLNDVMRVLEDMRREMRQRGPDRPQPEGGRRPSGRESREESREVIKNVEPLPEIKREVIRSRDPLPTRPPEAVPPADVVVPVPPTPELPATTPPAPARPPKTPEAAR